MDFTSQTDSDGTTAHTYADGSEFRLVHRSTHDTIYLSSHGGCGLGCRMCHLTATGQTRMVPLRRFDIIQRACALLTLRSKRSPLRINFAFMARGDALTNPQIDGELFAGLMAQARAAGGDTRDACAYKRMNISTIFPETHNHVWKAGALLSRFDSCAPTLYWSLYTLDEETRLRWMPQAASPYRIAAELRDWQIETGLDIYLHFPLIRGVNDTLHDASMIEYFMQRHRINYRVNLIQFNPPPGIAEVQATDDSYEEIADFYGKCIGYARVQMKPRVGYAVNASCGMFNRAPA